MNPERLDRLRQSVEAEVQGHMPYWQQTSDELLCLMIRRKQMVLEQLLNYVEHERPKVFAELNAITPTVSSAMFDALEDPNDPLNKAAMDAVSDYTRQQVRSSSSVAATAFMAKLTEKMIELGTTAAEPSPPPTTTKAKIVKMFLSDDIRTPGLLVEGFELDVQLPNVVPGVCRYGIIDKLIAPSAVLTAFIRPFTEDYCGPVYVQDADNLLYKVQNFSVLSYEGQAEAAVARFTTLGKIIFSFTAFVSHTPSF